MRAAFFSILGLVTLFAGQASALNITFGGVNITAPQALQIPAGFYSQPCQSQCDTANSTITACDVQDNSCLCQNSVGQALQQCEECLFTQLIAANVKAPDARVGSNPLLAAFTTACNVSFTPALTLSLPSNWVGPTTEVMPTAPSLVVAGIGGILGFSCLLILSNI